MATTISNSGGPGSPTGLSPVTIAVRDKVIEKFQDQPLREMNESLKMLLSKEQDEQKRLGILAARVYILRQRITALADPAPDMVVSAGSPGLKDTDAADQTDQEAGDDTSSEWTRLRILEDCEVNGVRFPKTVIIDVKSIDAQRLIDSGNAELIEERPEASGEDVSQQATAGDSADETSAMQAELDASPADTEAGDIEPAAGAGEDATDDAVAETDIETEAGVEAAQEAEAPETETETETETNEEDEAAEQTVDASNAGDEGSESVINAPSAAEVTAALEALSSGGETSDATEAETESADEAAAVAAELEAAAAAMAAPPSSSDSDDGDDDSKPSGWFEAQQNAEKAAKAETDDENEGGDPADEKS